MVILGAGPAGLVLGNVLLAAGVDCVILERADRARLAARPRAGFLAPNTVRVLDRHRLAEGLHRHGREHAACEFRTEDGSFRLDYGARGRGERHTVYPQHLLVGDLLAHFQQNGGQVRFGVEALAVLDTRTSRPRVTARRADGPPETWQARYVAGCDGRHGAARRSLPPGAFRHHRYDHGVSWLGLLAEAPPSLDAVGYAVHPNGFAGHMARTSSVTRYYLQTGRGGSPEDWSEARIWRELELRMRAAEHGPLHHGPIVQRTLVDFESDVIEPLRHGSLFLAGDAASLLCPAAAKGANLAVLEAELLAEALVADLLHGEAGGLATYSERCLRYIWRAQEFSHWMVRLLHAAPGDEAGAPFHDALRRSRLDSLRSSRSHQDWFAEHYVGV
ncbi:4-hydroxybenzoate 3-monooxygenase [Kitasatospora sp. NPDC002040]|uniref:4-hydroxybenzoate 3-monooxygenase n=1 Tax=Kitasatospora sp. NPDC002040 TaxID=3154661 RepID=UPI00331B0A78